MKEIFVTFAKQNEEADKAFVSILDKVSGDEREKNRKSYYGSLSGLARHVLGGTVFFLGMFKDAVANNPQAIKALGSIAKVEIFEDAKKLDDAQWKKLCSGFKTVDKAYIDFVTALNENEFNAPLKTDWYKGKPGEVPLSFMLEQLVAHSLHHRGQISQVLDTLKIDNDYSGINVKFL